MDEAEARRLLGVGSRVGADQLRTSFRRRLRRAHPDVVPDDPAAARATALLVEAYNLLRPQVDGSGAAAVPPPPPGGTTPGPASVPGDVAVVALDGDSLTYPAPPDEVYRRLSAAADTLGELTYVDPDARLLDTVVTTAEGTACSLLASLQGRAHGTEVFFTIEPLGPGRCPPVEPLVAELAALLARGRPASPFLRR